MLSAVASKVISTAGVPEADAAQAAVATAPTALVKPWSQPNTTRGAAGTAKRWVEVTIPVGSALPASCRSRRNRARVSWASSVICAMALRCRPARALPT